MCRKVRKAGGTEKKINHNAIATEAEAILHGAVNLGESFGVVQNCFSSVFAIHHLMEEQFLMSKPIHNEEHTCQLLEGAR